VNYDDFLPFVAPSAGSCPRDTLIHNIRLAAIEFCSRTEVWDEDLDTLLADGFSNSFELALDDQVDLAKLLEVTVKDRSGAKPAEADVLTPKEGRAAVRCGSTKLVAWIIDRNTIGIHPTPELDAEIDVQAALKPSLVSFDISDEVFSHHAEAIARGALARVLAMPNSEWSDLATAGVMADRFEDSITTAAAASTTGFSRQRRRHSRFF
jgi:hypothetical protein